MSLREYRKNRAEQRAVRKSERARTKRVKAINRFNNSQSKRKERLKIARGKLQYKEENKLLRQGTVRTFGIIGIIFLAVFIFAGIAQIVSGEPKTLQSFLLMLQDVPTVDFKLIIESFKSVPSIGGDLTWWQNLLVPFAYLINIVSFLLASIYQVIALLMHFLSWLFL